MKKNQQEDYGKSLQEAYDRWEHIYKHGTSDPTWDDSVNLNLVRNHILYYRGKLEENPTLLGYPAAYYKELPPETEPGYMARADEIRAAAKIALERYKADPNYQYIVQHRDDFTKKTRDKLSIDNVTGYATGLERYIKEDELVGMRRHERCEGYLKSFEDCVLRMQKAPPEVTQRSMFSLTADTFAKSDDDQGSGDDEYDDIDGNAVDEDGNDDEPETEVGSEALLHDEEKIMPPAAEAETIVSVKLENSVKIGADSKTPATGKPNYDNIPDELKRINQWCVYRTYPDKESDKLKKVIISPVNSAFAHIDMPETWVSYEQAKAYMERYKHYKGLVFALDKGNITFIDIDRAIKDGVIVSPEAKRLLELLPDAYIEVSTSGTGIHLLVKANLPADAYRRNDKSGIEMYDKCRFICMTGDTLNGSRELKDYSDKIADIAYKFAGKRPPRTEYTAMPATQSDTALIEQISRSRSATKFEALYRGDTSGYPSHSHAESAMVFMLAWWSQNPAQIDSIVRSSGLIRPKWDERRGSGTYGSQLIDEALSTVAPREQPQIKKQSQNYL